MMPGVEAAEFELPQALFAPAVGKRDQGGHLDAPRGRRLQCRLDVRAIEAEDGDLHAVLRALDGREQWPHAVGGFTDQFHDAISPPPGVSSITHRLRRGDLRPLGGLDPVHVRIDAVAGQQRLVRALFDQFGVLHHEDDVRVADRPQVMCDDDGRPPFHQGVKGADHGLLGDGVQSRSRLVENQDRRIADDRPGNGDALALTARERHASFADQVS